MAEMKEKHARRVQDLINAKWAAIFLLVGGLIMPLLSPITVIVGLLYGFEARRFLRLYPDMEPSQASGLATAKTLYFIMALVHLGLWVLIGALVGIIVLTGPASP